MLLQQDRANIQITFNVIYFYQKKKKALLKKLKVLIFFAPKYLLINEMLPLSYEIVYLINIT